jgi:hypothetical protein
MATMNINPEVSFTYTYGEENKAHFTKGAFHSRASGSFLGIELKVTKKTRAEAVDAICHYATLVGNDINQ